MITIMHKTGEKIFDTLRLVKKELGIEYRSYTGSLNTREIYSDKIYSFSWFMSKKGEFVYVVKELKDADEKEEDKKMTKEEALQKIEELKEYVEKCEEKEKEIPEMPRHGNHNIRIAVPDKPRNPYISWDRSFENQESADLYNILSFELAQLVYVRNYLGVKGIDATDPSKTIWHVWFCPSDKMYRWTRYRTTLIVSDMISDEVFAGWFFENEDDANRVRDYMNKYVKDVKKNMF